MSLSDSPRVSPRPFILSPTDTTGRTEGHDASRQEGAFTGNDEKGPRRPVINQRDRDAVRKRLDYYLSLSDSDESVTSATADGSTDSAGEAGALPTGTGGLQPSQAMARVSSTDPQLISLASPPVTTAGATAVAEAARGGAAPVNSDLKKEAITPQTQALFTGIRSGKRRLFEQLPQQKKTQRSWGIHIDWQDKQTGRSPLTLALALREWDIAVELLSLGADPDLLDGIHDAPSDLASPICKMILQFFSWDAMKQSGDWTLGIEVILKDLLLTRDAVDGDTMLTWAAGRRHDKLACRLIDAGAGFDFCSTQGEGPLEAACRNGSLSLVLTMLDAWPRLVTTNIGRAYFRMGLRAAIEAKRPAVVGEMLSAFRRIYRAGGRPPAQDNALDVEEIIPRDWRSEAEAYHAFFGGQASTTFVFDTALQRTRDDCLLTREECALLMLSEMEMLAVRKGSSKVLEVIEAHYKPATGIPRTTTVAGRGQAGNASRASSGEASIPESTSESTPESTRESTPESSLDQ